MFYGHLVLSIGNILAKEFRAPKNCASAECVVAATAFAKLAKSAIISAWKQEGTANEAVAKENAKENHDVVNTTSSAE